MGRPCTIVFLRLTVFFCLSALEFAASEAAFVVKGRVYCDTCDADRLTNSSWNLRDAKVAVQCTSRAGAEAAYVEGRTNKDGVFKIKVDGEYEHDRCVAILLQSSSQVCNLLIEKPMSSLKLSTRKLPNTVVQAGPFTFKPLHHSAACTSQLQKSASHLDSHNSPNQKPLYKRTSSPSRSFRLLYKSSYKPPPPRSPSYYTPPAPPPPFNRTSSHAPYSVFNFRNRVLVEVCSALLLRFMQYY